MERATYRLTGRKLLPNCGCSAATPNGGIWPIERIDESRQRRIRHSGLAHGCKQPVLVGFMSSYVCRSPLCGHTLRHRLRPHCRTQPRALSHQHGLGPIVYDLRRRGHSPLAHHRRFADSHDLLIHQPYNPRRLRSRAARQRLHECLRLRCGPLHRLR